MAENAHSTPAPATQPAPVTLTKKAEAYVARQLRPKGCPPGIDPAEWRNAIAKRIERHRDAEQALIEALDAVEIDPDLEPDADLEPSLGSNAVGAFDIDRELDNCDDEPSMGWSDNSNQSRIATQITFDPDREEEHDGREPEEDKGVEDDPHDDINMDLEPEDEGPGWSEKIDQSSFVGRITI